MDGIRTHAFLSFANVDVDIVRRLATRLQAEGVAVWTGDEKLTPGTVDWEQAVRGAIDASFAVVLVASPASARSVYVRGELGIAGTRALPLFSVWVQGESWADCAPLMLASSQYVDCRGEEFERGTSTLASALRPLAERAIPNHFAHPLLEPFPLSCVAVALPPAATANGTAGASAAILKITAYSSLEALLDELYANYLREHYAPLTYGKSWMLVEARTDAFGFVVAPWSWLTGAPIDRQWVRRHSPAQCHVLPGTRWQVTAVPGDEYGLALADPRVLGALRATAKSDLAMRRDGYLEFQPVSDVDATVFPCTMVCRGRSRFWSEDVRLHMALVQVKPVPEDELQWYLSDRVRHRSDLR
jgi:TIR domain